MLTTLDFNLFMSELKDSNRQLGFFCDFNKIKNNISTIKVKLCALNAFIGSTNYVKTSAAIRSVCPSALDALNIIVAVRDAKINIYKTNGCTGKDTNIVLDEILSRNYFTIQSLFKTDIEVADFIKQTKLDSIFKNKDITDICSYVFGIETGLDTNARKNRGGKIMETDISSILDAEGYKGLYASQYSSKKDPSLQKAIGSDVKVFDFAIKTNSTTYLIEVNFYNNGGSKLNEVARSYSQLSPKINLVKPYKFVWITDGKGWLSARSKIENAVTKCVDEVYNFQRLRSFLDKIKKEGVIKI